MFKQRVPAIFGDVMMFEAATFIIGSMAHIPISIGPIDEPRIVPAAVAEALCALALAAGALPVLRGSPRSWEAAVAGHVAASAGVVLGIVALAAGRGPRTGSNDAYHAAILTALVIGLAVLLRNQARWRSAMKTGS